MLFFWTLSDRHGRLVEPRWPAREASSRFGEAYIYVRMNDRVRLSGWVTTVSSKKVTASPVRGQQPLRSAIESACRGHQGWGRRCGGSSVDGIGQNR